MSEEEQWALFDYRREAAKAAALEEGELQRKQGELHQRAVRLRAEAMDGLNFIERTILTETEQREVLASRLLQVRRDHGGGGGAAAGDAGAGLKEAQDATTLTSAPPFSLRRFVRAQEEGLVEAADAMGIDTDMFLETMDPDELQRRADALGMTTSEYIEYLKEQRAQVCIRTCCPPSHLGQGCLSGGKSCLGSFISKIHFPWTGGPGGYAELSRAAHSLRHLSHGH